MGVSCDRRPSSNLDRRPYSATQDGCVHVAFLGGIYRDCCDRGFGIEEEAVYVSGSGLGSLVR